MLHPAGSQGLWRNYRNWNKSEICQTGAVSADIWRLLLPGQSKSLFYYLFLVNSQKYTIFNEISPHHCIPQKDHLLSRKWEKLSLQLFSPVFKIDLFLKWTQILWTGGNIARAFYLPSVKYALWAWCEKVKEFEGRSQLVGTFSVSTWTLKMSSEPRGK